MVFLPTKAPNEDVSEYFGGYARGHVQRVPGPFEFDNVSLALFYLLLQCSYRVDVDLTTHSGVKKKSGGVKYSGMHYLTPIRTLVLDFGGLAVRRCNDVEAVTLLVDRCGEEAGLLTASSHSSRKSHRKVLQCVYYDYC